MTILIPFILVRSYLEILKKFKSEMKGKIIISFILTLTTYFFYGGATNYDNLNRFILSGLGLTAYMLVGTLVCGVLANYVIERYLLRIKN